MNTKEKAIIVFALTALANNLNIKDTELSTTEKLTNKFDKVLKENENTFKDETDIKLEIIKMFKKYVNKLDKDNKSDNKIEKGG
jgi:uncharacterized membrane protein required for colicin V production